MKVDPVVSGIVGGIGSSTAPTSLTSAFTFRYRL